MKRLTSLLAALFLLLVSTTWSQELSKRITNKDVIDMTAVGLSDDIIIAKIRGAAAGGMTPRCPTDIADQCCAN